MALRKTVEDRHYDSYTECEGNTAQRTTLCGSAAFSPSGLQNGGRITEVTLNSTSWTALPPSALTDRNAICVQNLSGIEIKINYDDSETGYVGVVVADKSERFYDITDNVVIYAKSASATPTVTIEEIS